MKEDSRTINLDRIALWLTKQCPLAPARTQFRLCRLESGGGEIALTELERGKPSEMAAAIDNSIASDLAALSGNQSFRLYALLADGRVVASLAIRGKGGQEEQSSATAITGQMTKLLGEVFENQAKHAEQFHRHVMDLMKDERQEIRDLRTHTAELTRELLDVRVDNAKLEAGKDVSEGAEITKQIVAAIQSLPTTVAYTIKAFKANGAAKELPAGSSPLTPLKDAAKQLSDQEILAVMRVLIAHPEVAKEMVGHLGPPSKAAVMIAVQTLSQVGKEAKQDSENPKEGDSGPQTQRE